MREFLFFCDDVGPAHAWRRDTPALTLNRSCEKGVKRASVTPIKQRSAVRGRELYSGRR
jgi:hypothetical protein